MLEKEKEQIGQYNAAIERIEALENFSKQIENAKSFAVIEKDGKAHFVILSPEQAQVVNGTSIPIEMLEDAPKAMQEVIGKSMQKSLAEAKKTIAPLSTASGVPVANITSGNKLTPGPTPPH